MQHLTPKTTDPRPLVRAVKLELGEGRSAEQIAGSRGWTVDRLVAELNRAAEHRLDWQRRAVLARAKR